MWHLPNRKLFTQKYRSLLQVFFLNLLHKRCWEEPCFAGPENARLVKWSYWAYQFMIFLRMSSGSGSGSGSSHYCLCFFVVVSLLEKLFLVIIAFAECPLTFFLQKTAILLVRSWLALGSPGWLFIWLVVTMPKMAQYIGKWLLTAPQRSHP